MNIKTKKVLKRTLAFALALLMVLTIAPTSAFAVPEAENYYTPYEQPAQEATVAEAAAQQGIVPANVSEIANWTQLQNFLAGQGLPNGHFLLTANIDVPFGQATQGRPGVFTGTFDGGGHAITGLNFISQGASVGLFQELGPGAVVENLTLANSVFSASTGRWSGVTGAAGASGFGFIAGSITPGAAVTTIRNVTITNATSTVTGTVAQLEHTRVGGVVGMVLVGGNLVIENVTTHAIVNGGQHVGGVLGHTAGTGSVVIRDTVVGPESPRIEIRSNRAGDVGGFVGLVATQTRLENVTNNANVTAAVGAVNLGGLVGRATGPLDIRNGANHGTIHHVPAAIQRSGGLVGWSTHRLEINGGFNSGDLTSAGTNRDAANRMGGIVGRADHAAAAANRRIIIHNVENVGNIIRPVHTAGGIVGHIAGGTASDITQVTNAINRGAVPTRQNGGGIVGWVGTPGTLIGGLRAGAWIPGATVPLNAAQAAEQTRGSLNYGAVTLSLDGQGTTAGRRNASLGGIVGNNVGASTNVHQAGNYGRILGQHRTTGTGAGSRGGTGGIIGRQAGAGALIQQVFNMGHISSNTGTRTDSSRMVGGIIGHQRAGGTLEEFYSVGPVTSTGGNRRASGIIGMRTSGTMAVRNGYVATRIGANDLMLGTSGTTAANPAVAGLSFTQVYIVNTIGPPTGAGGVPGGTDANRNILQNHRGGIIIGSDILAMGVLPGVSGGPWRSGILEIDGTATDFVEGQSTLPYFAWQTAHTAHGLQERFFYQITPSDGHLFAPTPATGSTSISFTGVRYPEETRMFDPRNHMPGASDAGSVGRPLVPGPAGTVSVAHHNVMGTATPVNGRLTWGLISPDGVIGFGAAADSDVFWARAVDADCPERTAIAHAQFTAQPGMNPENTAGIFVVRIGYVVPGNWFSATALGYHPTGQITITENDIGIGTMEVEMRRAPINRAINVFVRDGSAEVAEGASQPNLFHGTGAGSVGAPQANSTRFEHIERLVPTTGTEPGPAPWTPEWAPQYTYRTLEGGIIGAGERAVVGAQGIDARLAQIPAGETMVGQRMRAGSAGFDWEDFAFSISMLDEITTGTGPLVMTIDLEDIRLTSPVPVRVVEHTVDPETGDDIFTNIPGATLTAEVAADRIPPLGALGVTGNNPFQLSNATMYTVLTAGATGFITRVVYAGDYYEPFQPADDGEPAVPASIMIVLEPEIVFDVLVVEEVVINGVPTQRPIGGASLHLDDVALPGSGNADNAGLFLDVTTATGDVIVASAPGFYFTENSHVVAREDHGRSIATDDPVVIALVRETPPPGTIRGFVWDAYTGIDTIPGATVVLLRQTAAGWELADNETTNAFGFYTFTNVATPGTYRVMASHADFVTNTAEIDPIVLGLSEGVLADVYLQRRGPDPENYILLVDVISGDTNQPIAAGDATVTFNGTAMTHDGETWRLTLPAATSGDVRVEAEGYRLGVATVTAASFAHNFRFVRVILIPLPDLPPEHGGIHGFVTNSETHAAIPGASVVITNAVTGAVVFNGVTDAYGRYERQPLPVGNYNVTVSHPNFAPQSRQVAVTDGVMTRADFALVPDPGTYEYTLQVIVTVDPVAPIPAGTEVLLVGGAALTRVGTGNVWIMHTDNPLAATQRVTVNAPEHHSDDAAIGTYTNRIATVELTLRPHDLDPGMGGIRGMVTAAAGGAPVAGATVTISNAGGIVSTTTTDAQGRYAVANLTPGNYTVTVVRAGFISQSRGTATVADTWTTEDFILVAGGGPGNYTLLAIVTGPPADVVTVTTGSMTLTRIDTSNLWELRTVAQLPATQLVHASATGLTHYPGSAPVGTYAHGVAQVVIALLPITIQPGERGVEFRMNDGTPAIHHTAVVTVGSTVNPPANPVRTGFTFLGWYTHATTHTAETRFDFGTQITENLTLYARWQTGGPGVTHTARFWLNDGSGNLHYVAFVPDETQLTAPAAPTRVGFTFLHWSETESDFIRGTVTAPPAFNMPVAITGDVALHAIWQLGGPDGHTVVFRMNDGTNRIHHTAIVDTGRTVTPPTNPVRAGYTFLGWDVEGGGAFNFGTPITDHLVLNARWETGGPGVTHTVEFWRNDGRGNLHYAAFVPAGGQLTAPTAPNRASFAFQHWSLTAAQPGATPAPPVFAFPATVTTNLSLHAFWIVDPDGPGDYTVTFWRNDGTIADHAVVHVNRGDTVNPPENPVHAGHTFLGWYTHATTQTAATRFDFGTQITGNLNLYARWETGGPGVTHTIRFWRNDGSGNLHYVAYVPDGQQLVAPPTNPSRAGFTFLHWSVTESDFIRGAVVAPPAFTMPMTPTGDVVLHAVWQLGGDDGHTVVFRMNDGTNAIHHTAIVDTGRTVTPPANPTRDGYTFLGWDIEGGGAFDFGTLITNHLVLNARWEAGGPGVTHTVLFWRNYGANNLHYAAFVPDGGQVSAPADPIRANFVFLHWSATTDGPAATFPVTVTGDMPFHAMWRQFDDLDDGYGGIFGVVTGPAGPVADATVMISDAAGIVVRTVTTDAQGRYSAPNLAPGFYTVMVVASEHAIVSRPNVEVEADEWTEENFTLTAQAGRYILIATVTGAPADEVTVTTNGITLTRIPDNANSWQARTETALPATQLVNASAGLTHNPASAPVGTYTNRVAHVALALTPFTVGPGQHGVEFRMNDGTPAVHHTVAVDAGRTVNPPANPVRTGFTFLGWYTHATTHTAETRFDFGTPITAPLTLYARWQTGGPGVTHTARFWRNDGTGDLHYVAFVPAETQLTAPAAPTRVGFTFLHWSETESDFIRGTVTAPPAFNMPIAITGDVALHAIWQLGGPDGHTVVFRMNDGTNAIHHTAIVDTGRTVTPPTNPVRAGYTFRGWDVEGGGAFNFGTPITDHLVLNARWETGGPGVTHTVEFWRNDGRGNLHYAAFVPAGGQLTAPTAPNRASFAFQHWSLTAAQPGATPAPPVFAFPATVTTNLSLHAFWIVDPDGPGDYTVTFWRNDGTIADHAVVHVNRGDTVNPPENPVHAGHTFLGWYTHATTQTAATRFDFGTQITGNLNLYARWETGGPGVTHTIRFWRNDGSGNLHYVAYVPDGQQLVAPPTNPSRAGFTFLHWSVTESDFIRGAVVAPPAFTMPMTPTGDVVLHAVWQLGGDDGHTVVFRMNDGTNAIHHTAIVDTGRTVTPPANPTRAGYTFLGWDIEGGGAFDFGTLITDHLVLNARWETGGPGVTHTVLFWRNDVVNNLHSAAFVPDGGQVSAPTPNPLRSGYLFLHWSAATDGPAATFPVTVTGDMAFHGIWEALAGYRVNFWRNDGSTPDVLHDYVFVEGGSTVNPPAVPTRTGYTFRAWYTNPAATAADRFSFGTPITGALDLYAGWDAGDHGPVQTVSFWRNDDSGNLHEALFVRNGNTVTAPANPTRTNHTFTAWHTNTAGTAPFVFTTPITADLDLYADWTTEGNHRVRFWSTGGESVLHTVFVPHGTTVTPPANPTRTGYTFLGWFTDVAATMAFDFGTPITENLELYPGWRSGGPGVTHTVLFYRNDGSGNLHQALFVEDGARAVPPADPTRTGYTFLGWHTAATGGTLFNFNTAITEDHSLHAAWFDNSTPGYYAVVFRTNDGTNAIHASAQVAAGRTVAPPVVPERDDFTFRNWYTNTEATTAFSFGTAINANLELFAGWDAGDHGPVHTVRFYRNDGSGNLHHVAFVRDDAQVVAPAVPVRTGHTFRAWHTNEAGTAPFVFTTPITANLVLFADWFVGVNIDVDIDEDGNVTIDVYPPDVDYDVTVEDDQIIITLPDTDEDEIGVDLPDDWDYDIDTDDDGNTIVIITPPEGYHLVVFRRNDNTAAIHSMRLVADNNTVAPPTVPTREGYTFRNWYTTDEATTAFHFGTPITANRELFAGWDAGDHGPVHTVLFWRNYGAGNLHYAAFVRNNAQVARPVEPERNAHEFQYWYRDSDGTYRFVFTTPITADLGLYADWELIDVFDPVHHAFMIGDPQGLIRPQGVITRAEVATIIFRLYLDEYRAENWSRTNPFPDVFPADWYNNAISTVTRAGTFQGFPDGTFRPNQLMTRAELAVAMARAYDLDLYAHTGADVFTDIAGHWARRYINAIAAEGWVQGKGGGIFDPEGDLTRAEVAQAFNNMLGRHPEDFNDLLPGMRTWPDNADMGAWYFLAIQEASNSHTHVMKDDGIHESWVQLLPRRPWENLERPDSTPASLPPFVLPTS